VLPEKPDTHGEPHLTPAVQPFAKKGMSQDCCHQWLSVGDDRRGSWRNKLRGMKHAEEGEGRRTNSDRRELLPYPNATGDRATGRRSATPSASKANPARNARIAAKVRCGVESSPAEISGKQLAHRSMTRTSLMEVPTRMSPVFISQFSA